MAETKKRIIQYNEELTPGSDDYLLLDSPTNGTRKILASNIGGGGGNANVTELTYAQYMALTPAERANGTIYMVTDDPNDSDVHVPINYSTEEQNTGLKWVDGKDIYQKTIVKNNTVYGDATQINTGVSDMDKLVDHKCTLYFYDAQETPPITDSGQSILVMHLGGGVIMLGRSGINIPAASDRTWYLTLFYTKTN